MKISFISFTSAGMELSIKVIDVRKKHNDDVQCYIKSSGKAADGIITVNGPLSKWTAEKFKTDDAIVFIGATAIAVRSIAPFLKSKTTDPAVLSIDEKGKFVIPLVSGHIGGANKLAEELADEIGGQAIITTATDINGLFAVDEWAARNCMHIVSMKKAKEIAVALLNKEQVGVVSDFQLEGRLPDNVVNERKKINMDISVYRRENREDTLQLIPRALFVGIGCRRDTDIDNIRSLLFDTMKESNLAVEGINTIASIELKKDEKGLNELCQQLKIPFVCYSSDELKSIEGNFTKSDFVASVTGVDNVCERAALCAAGDKGRIIVNKTSRAGVTVAVAIKDLTFKL